MRRCVQSGEGRLLRWPTEKLFLLSSEGHEVSKQFSDALKTKFVEQYSLKKGYNKLSEISPVSLHCGGGVTASFNKGKGLQEGDREETEHPEKTIL